MNSTHKKRIEAEKNGDKDGKVLYKLKKTMENLRNAIDVRLVNNKKDYLKRTSKPGACHTNYLTMIFSQYVKAKLH